MRLVPPWSNQNVVLYHGTDLRSAENILEHGADVHYQLGYRRHYWDFGKGFYCTTLMSQALEWARSTAALRGGTAAVLRFSIPRNQLARLDTLAFTLGTTDAFDYWNFVQFCRFGGQAHGRVIVGFPEAYDVVYGPVAQNWETLRQKPESDQVSFHTTAA